MSLWDAEANDHKCTSATGQCTQATGSLSTYESPRSCIPPPGHQASQSQSRSDLPHKPQPKPPPTRALRLLFARWRPWHAPPGSPRGTEARRAPTVMPTATWPTAAAAAAPPPDASTAAAVLHELQRRYIRWRQRDFNYCRLLAFLSFIALLLAVLFLQRSSGTSYQARRAARPPPAPPAVLSLGAGCAALQPLA